MAEVRTQVDALLDAVKRDGLVDTGKLSRELGVETKTIERWLRQLEDENRRLKQLVADQSLDLQALKAALGKKW